ncbi:MAG: Crp/Fnr family transcriptional regulator [bacterium]
MPEPTKLWYLKNFDLFSELSTASLAELSDQTEMHTFCKKEIISFPPTYRKYIHFLKIGHVKIYRLSEGGQEVIVELLGPGEIFGDLPCDEDANDDAVEITETLDKGLLCTMRQQEFLEFANAHPCLNRRLLKWMVLRFRRIESRLEDLVCKDARHRIYSFIRQYAQDFGKQRNGLIVMPKFLSQEEIAFVTATSRQTVASTLNDLRRDGVLDFTRSSMTIYQPGQLS